MTNTFYGSPVTIEDLEATPIPEATSTFTPVPHTQVVEEINAIAVDVLTPRGFQYADTKLTTSHKGNRLFGLTTFQDHRHNGTHLDRQMDFAIGFRSAYDKSMSLSLAVGGSVLICSNMMIAGEIMESKKHTGDVVKRMREAVVLSLYQAEPIWDSLNLDVDVMSRCEISDTQAYGLLGRAAIDKIVPPTSIIKMAERWNNPMFDYNVDGQKTMYRWYNTVTEAFRALPNNITLQKHRALHQWTMRTVEIQLEQYNIEDAEETLEPTEKDGYNGDNEQRD